MITRPSYLHQCQFHFHFSCSFFISPCYVKLIVYCQRSQLLFSSLGSHISEIISIVAAHISSQASPVFGTSAKKVQKCRTISKNSKHVWTLPNAFERIRTCPTASGKVRTGPNTFPNLQKLPNISENFAKTFESRVRAIVVFVSFCKASKCFGRFYPRDVAAD